MSNQRGYSRIGWNADVCLLRSIMRFATQLREVEVRTARYL
jgi:hypothetical protein